jgi:hypothetical protein
MKYIVLDLDDTLIHAFSPTWACKLTLPAPHNIMNAGCGMYCLHVRPWFRQFVEWCHEQDYEIVIFSAGSESYVNDITKTLWQDFDKKPSVVMSARELDSGYVKTIDAIIRKLGPSVTKNQIVCVDDLREHYVNDLDRVVWVDSWDGKLNDCELVTIQDCIIKMFHN